MSHFLVKIRTQVMDKSSLYVKISVHYKDKINVPIHDGECRCSNFLKNVPTDETQTMLRDNVASNPH